MIAARKLLVRSSFLICLFYSSGHAAEEAHEEPGQCGDDTDFDEASLLQLKPSDAASLFQESVLVDLPEGASRDLNPKKKRVVPLQILTPQQELAMLEADLGPLSPPQQAQDEYGFGYHDWPAELGSSGVTMVNSTTKDILSAPQQAQDEYGFGYHDWPAELGSSGVTMVNSTTKDSQNSSSGPDGKLPNANISKVLHNIQVNMTQKFIGIAYSTNFWLVASINGVLILLCLIVLAFAICLCPKVYTSRALPPAGSSPFSWPMRSLAFSSADLLDMIGIDQALLLEFTTLAMTILCLVCIPLLCIAVPVNVIAGDVFSAQNADGPNGILFVGRAGMANLAKGDVLSSWMYAFLVWYVIGVTQMCVYGARAKFKFARLHWLKTLPVTRATTVLVTGIPSEYRGDAKLLHALNILFYAKAVKHVHFVQSTVQLVQMFRELRGYQEILAGAVSELHRTGMRPNLLQKQHDSITHFQEQESQTKELIRIERERMRSVHHSAESASVCCDSAFVTFYRVDDACEALTMDLFPGSSVVEVPDAPDVIYSSFLPRSQHFSGSIAGYILMCILILVCLLLAVANAAGSDLAVPESVMRERKFRDADSIENKLWNTMFGVTVLSILSFMPPLVLWIVRHSFGPHSWCGAQLIQQRISFPCMVMYVILATSVILTLIPDIVRFYDPGGGTLFFRHFLSFRAVVEIVGTGLPHASFFYLGYFATQWTLVVGEMVRFPTLVWHLVGRRHEGESHRVGARSVVSTTSLVAALCFSTMCPLLAVLAAVEMAIRRTVYGFLACYSENSKSTSGGMFYVAQLNHLQHGLFVYLFLMVVVLSVRAQSLGPPILAGLALLPLIWSYVNYHREFSVDPAPVELVKGSVPLSSEAQKDGHKEHAYVQPELCEQLDTARLATAHPGTRTSLRREKQGAPLHGLYNGFMCCNGATQDARDS